YNKTGVKKGENLPTKTKKEKPHFPHRTRNQEDMLEVNGSFWITPFSVRISGTLDTLEKIGSLLLQENKDLTNDSNLQHLESINSGPQSARVKPLRGAWQEYILIPDCQWIPMIAYGSQC
ncbi:hypothetical protein ACJX0J_016686, partial [Zea mays]